MACAGVVDRDIGGAAQARGEHSRVLGAEHLEPGRQQAHDLPLRNHHAHAVEQREDALAGHLSGKMKRQHKADAGWGHSRR
jgi:hypothetical protein